MYIAAKYNSELSGISDDQCIYLECPQNICTNASNVFALQNVPSGALINWTYPTSNMYVISGQGTSEITLGAFTGGSGKIITVNVSFSGNSYIYDQIIDIGTGSNLPTPTAIIDPNNPDDLDCCNYQNWFYQTRISYPNPNYDAEWSLTIHTKGSTDIISHGTSTGGIGVLKNSFHPVILSQKVRYIQNCGNPSPWSSNLGVYYGTTSASSKSIQLDNYKMNENIPFIYFYNLKNKVLSVKSVNFYDWLDFKYSKKSFLNDNEITTAISLINNEQSFEKFKINIIDLSGNIVLDNISKTNPSDEIYDLNHLRKGIYIIKISSGGFIEFKKILVN